MKWWHALALLAVGFGVGRADVSLMGTAKWEVGSETEKELRALDLRVATLDLDRRFRLAPTKGDEESSRTIGAIQLRQQAMALESECQAAFTRHPETLSHQYLWLASRCVTDRAANLVVWHQLAGLPVPVPPCTHPEGTISQYIREAKQRMHRRGDVADPEPDAGGTDLGQALVALSDFFDCQW